MRHAPMIALIAGVYIGCLEVGDYRMLLICLHSVGNHEREGGRILVRFQMAGVVQIKFIIVVISSVTNRADKCIHTEIQVCILFHMLW